MTLSSEPFISRSTRQRRYLVAISLVIGAALLRHLLGESLGGGVPFITLFPAIVVAGWFGGTGPALLATALAWLLGSYLLLHPVQTSPLHQPGNIASAVMFLIAGSISAIFGGRLRDTSDDLREEHHRLAAEIVEREQAESFLRASEQRLQLALRSANLVAWEWNTIEDRLRWSDNFAEIFGRQPTATSAEARLTIFPEDRERHDAELSQALRNGGPFSSAFRIVRTDTGAMVWLEERAEVLKDHTGRAIHMHGVVMDVTERRGAEEASAQRERFIKAVTDAAPAEIYLFDVATRTNLYSNARSGDLLGYTADELTGMGRSFIARTMHQEDLRRLDAHLESLAAAKDGVIHEFEYRMRHRNGEWRWFLSRDLVFRRDETGRPGQILGVAADITERNEADEALRRLNESLERQVAERTAVLQARAAELARSNADLERFAYVASHDLQEPLRMVTNFTQLLQLRYQGKLDSNADELMNFVIDGVERMHALINDLLAYSRVRNRALEIRPVDLAALIQIVRQVLGSAIEERAAQVIIDPLPRISGDETQLLQLFQNLLGNALKFARPGVTPRIHLSGEQRDGFWEFRVEDNGIGIPAEYRERIFGMFQRLHARDEYPGTGIGLTICRTVVERHGGRIWAEDAAGSGTTFRFTLPSDPALLPAVEYGAALSDTDRIGAI